MAPEAPWLRWDDMDATYLRIGRSKRPFPPERLAPGRPRQDGKASLDPDDSAQRRGKEEGDGGEARQHEGPTLPGRIQAVKRRARVRTPENCQATNGQLRGSIDLEPSGDQLSAVRTGSSRHETASHQRKCRSSRPLGRRQAGQGRQTVGRRLCRRAGGYDPCLTA
jgi:hypothetical protein